MGPLLAAIIKGRYPRLAQCGVSWRCSALSDGRAADVPPHGRDPGAIDDGLEPADRAEPRSRVAVIVRGVRRLEVGRDAELVPGGEVRGEQDLADPTSAMVGIGR